MNEPPLLEEAIFLQALEIEATPDRVAFLDRACATDARLRAVVDALLRASAKSGDLLDISERPNVSPTVGQSSADSAGTQIGPYKLLQQIGEGGMGTVFMAEQLEPVQRRVALKIIKQGMDSRQVIARFAAEKQALALMDHVNIARVLDAGVTERGRPYFVMELVHGVPITKYCDDNHLTPRQRLELFVTVCQAIQHAHQKGIIHRDIKPSNVMVTLYDGKPVPKVIDFGVAKAMDQKLTEQTLFTQYGTMVGTLEYMSPEQAEMSALGVDTRSDIYSLGVLLYELLTGSTPLSRQQMKEAAYGEILRLIRDVEPPKPSTRLSESGESLASISAQRQTEPAKLSKLMRGELDWIVMKTLEKDRNRRYETANGLGADVQRYLNDEQVQACPPSALYRFHKFSRRNKRALATATVMMVALTLGTAVSTWQAIRATKAEGLAQERSETANANLETAEIQRRKAQAQLLLTEQAQKEGLTRLYESQLAQAKAGLLSRRPGQRFASLEALAEATKLARLLELPAESDLQLRNATIACLALPDMRPTQEWTSWPAGSTYSDFDGNLQRCALSDVQGAVSIRRVVDDTEIACLPPVGIPCSPLLSRDGKFILVHSAKGVQCWSLVEPKPVLGFDLPAENIVGMDFSPDSRKCVFSQRDGVITLLDLASGQPLRQLRQSDSGRAIALSNQHMAICCNTTVEVRELDSGEVSATLRHPAALNHIVWHPNGTMLASICNDAQVFLWDTTTSTGRQLSVLNGFKNGGLSIGFNHSGDLLATAGWEQRLRLWDSRTGQQVFSTAWGGNATPRFSADGRLLSGDIGAGKLRLWEIADCKEYRTLTHYSAAQSAPYYNPSVFGEGKLLAVGVFGGVGVWELSSGRELHFLDLPGTNFTASGGSDSLLTNGSAGLLRWAVVRESPLSQKLRIGPPQKLPVAGSAGDIACTSDGRVIASAQSAGGMVLHTERPDRPVPLVPQEDVRYISLSPDGKLVVTGSHHDTAVNIWNSESGALVRRLEGASWRAIFSPDGKWLGSVAGGFRLWKVDSWEEGPKIGGGEGAAFSPDTSLLAVESGQGSIRLLNPSTGDEYARLEDPHQDRARHITFSPDGTQLIATNDDSRSIHVWDLRLIRRQLASRGLDWNLPPYLPAEATDNQPLLVELEAAAAAAPPVTAQQQNEPSQ